MSFRLQPAAPARPNRCQLFGPGSRPALFEKMAASAADVINLDLEDSVTPDDKPQARANIIQAIGDIDWGKKYLSVRINGLDTPFWYRDVVDLLEQAGERIDQIMIPKVGCAADVYAVDALVTAIEAAKGLHPVGHIAKRFGVHPIQIGKWRKRLLENAHQVFEDGCIVVDAASHEREIQELYEQIGRLKVENDFLKKKSGLER